MAEQSRRGLLKNVAKAAVAAAGVSATVKATAQDQKGTKKQVYPPRQSGARQSSRPQLFSPAIRYGELLFVSGIGAHFPGDFAAHVKYVFDTLEKRLTDSGSSMEKVLTINVYLNDLKDYDKMNEAYAARNWGPAPPARTTVAASGGIPGNSLVEINCVAYI